MERFLAISLLIGISLLLTGRMTYRLRRSRPMVLLISGGWLGILIGAAMGPNGLGLVDQDLVVSMTPLVVIGLGWIGVMVGLQLRREVVASLPPVVWRVMVVDVVGTALTIGLVGYLLTWMVATKPIPPGVAGRGLMLEVSLTELWTGVLLVLGGSVGWAMETRSLRVSGATERGNRLALLLRTTGALGAVVAVLIFGVAATLLEAPVPLEEPVSVEAVGAVLEGSAEGGGVAVPEEVAREDPVAAAAQNDDGEAGEGAWDVVGGVVLLGVAVALGLITGLLGRYGLSLAGKARAHQLTIFLGLVCFVAGIGAQLGLSPVFVAMLAGGAIANLKGLDLRRFERFVLDAEHTVAMLFSVLAGVLVSFDLSLGVLAVVVVVVALRLTVKPALFRFATRGWRGEGAPPPGDLPERSPLYALPTRQVPIAIALAVGLVIVSPGVFHERLLTVVVLVGVLSDLLPLLTSFGRAGKLADMEARSVAAGAERVEAGQHTRAVNPSSASLPMEGSP